MTCEWRSRLDLYIDGELPEPDLEQLATHLRECKSCAAETLARVQMKGSIRAVAANAFPISPEFRARMTKVVGNSQRSRRFAWLPQIAFGTAVIIAALAIALWTPHGTRHDAVSEIADFHVATLASSNPVDIISTDRHTVKPWFEGKLPFTFNLPELQNSEFYLIGGRLAYVGQSPGAQLLFGIRKHQISVFVFQDRDTFAGVKPGTSQWSGFNVETWSQNGLRYLLISDAGGDDVHQLSSLLRAASGAPSERQ